MMMPRIWLYLSANKSSQTEGMNIVGEAHEDVNRTFCSVYKYLSALNTLCCVKLSAVHYYACHQETRCTVDLNKKHLNCWNCCFHLFFILMLRNNRKNLITVTAHHAVGIKRLNNVCRENSCISHFQTINYFIKQFFEKSFVLVGFLTFCQGETTVFDQSLWDFVIVSVICCNQNHHLWSNCRSICKRFSILFSSFL